MKILVLTPNYPRKNARMNGIFIHQQVKALQELGVECHVLLLRNWFPPFGLHNYHSYWREGYAQSQNYYDEYDGVKIHSVPVFLKMPDRVFKNSIYVQSAQAIISYIKRNKELQHADWIYAHFLTDCGYISSLVKKRLSLKLAVIARGDDVHAWPEQKPELVNNLKEVFRSADLILANSKKLASDTVKWMEEDNIRSIEVVYNGVNTEKFRPINKGERESLREKFKLEIDKKYLVCIATPVKLKGWLELLNAIKLLGDDFDGWQLLMIAPKRTNADAIDLQSVAEALNIKNRVLLLGQLDPENVAEVLRVCDAFILPSYNEGMANALLEAMASGICCIATDVGGHREVVNDGENGLLIKSHSIDEIVCALRQICDDEDLRLGLGSEARKTMINFGTYVENSASLIEILNKHSSYLH